MGSSSAMQRHSFPLPKALQPGAGAEAAVASPPVPAHSGSPSSHPLSANPKDSGEV